MRLLAGGVSLATGLVLLARSAGGFTAVMRNTVMVVCTLLLACACAVNPVTGKREFMVVPSAADIQVGEQNYFPMQQSQGGVYAVDPELTTYVQRVGNALAEQSGVELPYEFVVLNNSVPNAWALPGGKIAINRGLLTELGSEAELAAVLGHEVVHAAARHSARQQSRGMLLQGLVIASAIATSDSDYGNLAVGAASVGAQLLAIKYGRDAELESDYYGMQYMADAGYDPQGAVSLQETFVRLSQGRRSDWLSGLFSSHPPSRERVRANKATAEALPAVGTVGLDAYRQALAKTMRVKPAYDAYDAGRKALSEKRVDEALQLAKEALRLFPDEPHFHALRGDVRIVMEKFAMAVTNFGRAIDRNEDFFYYHLQRGLAHRELGNVQDATRDLRASVRLLPTAPGHFALGEMAYAQGRAAEAIEHFRVVAQSGGDYGKAAQDKLVRIELPENPGSYIAKRCAADDDGNLVVLLQNQTSVQVGGVRLAVRYTGVDGARQQRQFQVRERISPGQVVRVETGMGPFSAGGQCPADVVAANIVE